MTTPSLTDLQRNRVKTYGLVGGSTNLIPSCASMAAIAAYAKSASPERRAG
jgi:hypothetical protein